jgi:hypothetical protein
MRPFPFLACAAVAMVAILLPFSLFIAGARAYVPRPDFPIPPASYVSYYEPDYADQYLFRHGIFGFGAAIARSDVVLLGTSHVKFGLSAGVLGKELSTRGAQTRAFNAGLGVGGGILHSEDILRHGNPKAVVVDVYNPAGLEVHSVVLRSRESSTEEAYVRVANIWARFARDWILDGIVERFEVRKGFSRYLRTVVLRNAENGDVVQAWSPGGGEIFNPVEAPFVKRYAEKPDSRLSKVFSSAFERSLDSRSRHAAVLTLVPFPGYSLEEARGEAARLGRPFVAIEPYGLTYLDGDHLNAMGRAEATRRLAHGMGGQLPAKPRPP